MDLQPSVPLEQRNSSISLGVDLSGSNIPEETLASEIAAELFIFLQTDALPFSLHIYCTKPTILSFFSHPVFQEKIVFILKKDRVLMEDIPREAMRQKSDSTLFSMLRDHQTNSIQACITSANTGALVLGASHILKRFSLIRKVPLIAEIPSSTRSSPLILLDVGASPRALGRDFISYAFLGTAYVQNMYFKKKPSVGLLNIGVEAMKGTSLMKKIYRLFSSLRNDLFAFQGNIEPNMLFSKEAPEIIITSGFVGNIFLKTAEALIEEFHKKDGNTTLPLFKSSLSHSRNAAFLGGVLGTVYKCHGKARGFSIVAALFQAFHAAHNRLSQSIQETFIRNEELISRYITGLQTL